MRDDPAVLFFAHDVRSIRMLKIRFKATFRIVSILLIITFLCMFRSYNKKRFINEDGTKNAKMIVKIVNAVI